LGDYPAHSLVDAREWAKELRAMVDKGIDPRKDRAAKIAETQATDAKTLGHLIDAYYESLASRGKPTREQKSVLTHLPKPLLARPARDITGQDIAGVMAAVLEKGLRRTADKIRSYLSAAYRSALSAELDPTAPKSLHGFGLLADPVQFVKKIPNGGSAKKDRVLTRAELGAYHEAVLALPDADKDMRDFLLCHLFTGQRLRQLASAMVEPMLNDFDIVMADPKGRRDIARDHRIPLTGPALDVYQSRGNQLFGISDPVDKRTGESLRGVLTRFCDTATRRVDMIAEQLVKTGTAGSPFTATDLRRSVETTLMGLGFRREDLANLLSHGLGGVQAGHYDRHDYRDEKTRMLGRWADHVQGNALDNVAQLSRVDRKNG
jgi:hypothetical protein